MFLLFLLFITVPNVTIKGVYKVSLFPLITTFLADLFLYSILILTSPLLPNNSSGLISFPSNLYVILDSNGNSFSVSSCFTSSPSFVVTIVLYTSPFEFFLLYIVSLLAIAYTGDIYVIVEIVTTAQIKLFIIFLIINLPFLYFSFQL